MFKLKPVRSLVGIGILGAFGLIASGGAQALPGYCVGPPTQTDGLALTDVNFTIGSTIYGPIDCYGIVNTGSSDLPTNLAYVNALTWPDFVGGVKDETVNAGGGNSVTIGNIQYTLTAGVNSGSGLNTSQAWTLSWSDTNGSTVPNLPVTVDFALQWNGGNQDVFYLFDDVLLPASPLSGNGTIAIQVTNSPGNSDIGTSHLNAYFSNPTPINSSNGGPPSSGPIPEPGTLSLVGAAILGGLFCYRRRRQSLV